ncbi:hypothetical protein [Brevibacillus agri]|uniref:hypothetical protein n=1 Tax=Brevibacillus agri TaxID=51101 RepID=UPI0012DCFB3E|nr:hypothetical protein [Brevibacillus agri]MCG5253436.1 hypothetical protein [Brevibacillus agri]MDR9506254.1 hypothetical protein [Brevibacillus agri]MED4570918.1 hypothetical protein [Brevibacillus agri]
MPYTIREQYIHLPKLYDWVFVTSYCRARLPVPAPLRSSLHDRLRAGLPLSVQCLPPDHPCSCLPVSCRLLPPVRQAVHMAGSQRVPIAIARFIVEATLSVLFFVDGDLLFELPAPLCLEEEVALSLPQPLDHENITCRLAAAECRPNPALLQQTGAVELDVFLCLEILVEAPVVLEVIGRMCAPRPASIPVPPRKLALDCTPFRLPPNCPRLQ